MLLESRNTKNYSIDIFQQTNPDRIFKCTSIPPKYVKNIMDILQISNRSTSETEQLKAEIEKRGGKLIDTWKADASGVIVGKKAVGQETGKVKKALDKGIKVYTVDEFRAEFF